MRLGVLDVITLASQQNCVLVLPTLDHAIRQWGIYITAVKERHSRSKASKTSITMPNTKTTLRLWVPYEVSPTQPMDYQGIRRGYHMISPWFTRGELKRWRS